MVSPFIIKPKKTGIHQVIRHITAFNSGFSGYGTEILSIVAPGKMSKSSKGLRCPPEMAKLVLLKCSNLTTRHHGCHIKAQISCQRGRSRLMYHGLWVLHHGHRRWVQCVWKARVLHVSRMGRRWTERRVTIVWWQACWMGGHWLSYHIIERCRWHIGNLSLTLNP